jgi:hypothetical protein
LPSYSSQWIGIGGFLPNNQQNLIQTGTASLGVAGGNDYYAWYETLGTFPAAPYRLTNQVKSGDVMRAQISLTDSGTSQWNITISDSTQNWSVSNLVTYNSSEDTADWIEEHQFAIIGPLANFGTAQFGAQYTSASDTNYATIGNAPAPIAQLNRCQVSMVEGNVSIAQPSEISSDGTSFTVNRLATATPTPVPSNTSQVTIDSVLALNATDAATLSNTSVNGSSTYPQRAITTISSIPQPWLQVITLNSSFNDPQSLVSFFGFQTKTNLLPLSTSKAYAYSGFFYNGSTVVPFTAITDYVVVNPNDLQLVEWLDLGGEIASGENPEIIRLDIEKMIFEKAIETVSESETTIKQFEADIVSAYLDLASSSGGSSVATTSPFTSGTVILGTPTIPPLPGTAVTIPTTSPPTIGLPKPTTISNLPLPSALQLPSQAAPGK